MISATQLSVFDKIEDFSNNFMDTWLNFIDFFASCLRLWKKRSSSILFCSCFVVCCCCKFKILSAEWFNVFQVGKCFWRFANLLLDRINSKQIELLTNCRWENASCGWQEDIFHSPNNLSTSSARHPASWSRMGGKSTPCKDMREP